METNSQGQPRKSAVTWHWYAIALAGIGFAWFVLMPKHVADRRPGPEVAEKKKLTREESLKLLDQRDRAVALLENHEFAMADELLNEIIRRLPDDPFGPRNLAICRELAIEKIDAARDKPQHEAAVVKAREALELLAKAEPKSHVPHVFTARVAVRANEIDRAAEALKRATELAPKAAPVWYDLFVLRPAAPGEPPSSETIDALRKTYELMPDNLFVLKDWLPLQAQLKDPQFVETAEQAKETLAPFADIIKTHARVNVLELLDVVIKAARENQWPLVTGRTMAIRNVMISEAARDDRYVKLDSLEYLLQDFGPAFYERADIASPQTKTDSPVTFALAPPQQQPMIPAGVRDLAAIDLDLDGRIDSLTLHEDRLVATMPFSRKSADEKQAQVNVPAGGDYRGLCTVDLDDDVDPKLKDRPKDVAGCQLADPDVIVFGPAGLRLFENRSSTDGPREFIEQPPGDVLGSLREVLDVAPIDLDLDGDLDFLTVAAGGVRLWSNRGNWSFEEITSRSKLPSADFGPTAAAVCDWDRDSDLDVLVAGKSGFGVLESLRHGRFRWRDLADGFEALKQSQSLVIEELDGNGSWDLIGAGPNGVHVILTQTTAAGIVSIKLAKPLAGGSKVIPLDFNNDGSRDIALIEEGGAVLWAGSAEGTFFGDDRHSAAWLRSVTALTIADVDRDGDHDFILTTPAAVVWHANDGGNENGWLDVSLLAQQIKPNEQNYSKRVNHYGIGSTIEIKTGGRYQAQVVTGPITHFGLGPQKKADVVRVIWTNGIPRNLLDAESNLHVCEEQKLLGSCPYLFTWNGKRFEFVTDLLWNAPIGLKFAEDIVAPWREWEYLKIDGARLKAKDGEYQLRVTAELKEGEYFDQIKLFTVDHPAGTQVFTNEKVGPASMAEHRLHTVRSPRSAIAAKDTHGRDVLDQVKARDDVYTKTYDQKLAQGLTTEHFLELDLGDLGTTSPKHITLFLTGWMYPASTSLNVQFSQNPGFPQPRPPSLHAMGADGQWREVRPFMGFPGGKTKTIAIDISDVFPAGSSDHRLRISTNMEFYWDAVFFTVDEEPVEIHQTELPLLRANLVDRGGVSFREWPLSGNGPETFDYSRLVPGQHWPPMAGAFTRYGDVLPLLRERDDQLVVAGCGDEMQLAFAEPSEPLPEGWIRDFVIYNVGWDKDGDLNTVYGETVEPLPFRDMTVYAHRDGQPRPLDEEYVRYLKTYQTRTQSRPAFWNELRRRPGN